MTSEQAKKRAIEFSRLSKTYTLQAIGTKFGITRQAVWEALKYHGLIRKKRSKKMTKIV